MQAAQNKIMSPMVGTVPAQNVQLSPHHSNHINHILAVQAAQQHHHHHHPMQAQQQQQQQLHFKFNFAFKVYFKNFLLHK